MEKLKRETESPVLYYLQPSPAAASGINDAKYKSVNVANCSMLDPRIAGKSTIAICILENTSMCIL